MVRIEFGRTVSFAFIVYFGFLWNNTSYLYCDLYYKVIEIRIQIFKTCLADGGAYFSRTATKI